MTGVLSCLLLSFCSQPPELPKGSLTESLPDDAWNVSRWISAADAPVVSGTVYGDTRSADGSSWFVSSVRNEGRVVSAKWMTAGLGVYDLFVNGNRIGKEILKPGFTHYEKTKISFTYDITDAFIKGAGAENVLSAQVTPGWWADKIITPEGHEGMKGKKCAFRGVLELIFRDGSRKLYGTDTENWKAGIAGPVKHSSIFDGEEYDARELPGYETPEMLSVPEVNTEFEGELVPDCGAEVYYREDLTLRPVHAYVWKTVEGGSGDAYGKVVIDREYRYGEPMTIHAGENLVVDFGQNCAAVPSFVFKAGEGTTLTCLPGELLNDGNGEKSRGMDGPEGSVHRANLRASSHTGIRAAYTFAHSRTYVSYRPRYTFFGYRYVTLSTTDDVTIKSIVSVPVSSITKEAETGTITTGNNLVNKLISNSRWGQLSNYLSVPTDCPQRDERLGWMADTQVFAEAGAYFADTDRFFHKWLRDVRDSQNAGGGYPGVAPVAQYGSGCCWCGWADAGIIVPWTVWKQFGDESVVDECWESMERFMDHIARDRYAHEAHREENLDSQCADWLSYEPLESWSGRAYVDKKYVMGGMVLPETYEYWNYLCACYWAMDAGMMAQMAEATGRDASKYELMETEARSFIKSRFLTSGGEFRTAILNTMQTPALFALRTGVVEGKAKEDLLGRLRKNFEDHGNCLQTGFLGTSILMQTLTENGMADMAYELLLQRKNPSWLYSVDNGATTIWERWDSYGKDKGLNDGGMNSFNHYAYGAVCKWIWNTVAGIDSDPAKPGFKHIIMKPVPDKRLGSLDAEYRSAAGMIRSSWKYDGDKWIWNFTVPEGATATVTLPGESGSKDYGAGSYKIEK